MLGEWVKFLPRNGWLRGPTEGATKMGDDVLPSLLLVIRQRV
jgi:hypothetical protein